MKTNVGWDCETEYTGVELDRLYSTQFVLSLHMLIPTVVRSHIIDMINQSKISCVYKKTIRNPIGCHFDSSIILHKNMLELTCVFYDTIFTNLSNIHESSKVQ